MKITEKQIDKLNELQASENGGRGISCVKTIISYLKKGSYTDGLTCCFTDSDKIRGYPKIYAFMEEIFPEFKQFNARLRSRFGGEI